jgi:hypothetical protein
MVFLIIFISKDYNLHMKSLKQIIEESGLGGFSNENPQQQKMSAEAKKQLLGMVNQYNEVGKKLYEYGDVREIAERLLTVAELAEKYALEEASEDMLQTGRVERDMKDIKKEAGDLRKIALEAWKSNERLKASYERIGKTLENYYELN